VLLPQVHWGVKVGRTVVAAVLLVGLVGLIVLVAKKALTPTPYEPTPEESETIAAIMVDMADVIAGVEATAAAHWDRQVAASRKNNMGKLLEAKRTTEGLAKPWAEGRLLGRTIGQIAENRGA
jgi:hypothetical protein